MTCITLAADLDLNVAMPLRAELLALRGGPVSLDASQVDRLGALCLQVLLSAGRTWAEDGQPFAVAAASPAFTDHWTAFAAPPLDFAPQETVS